MHKFAGKLFLIVFAVCATGLAGAQTDTLKVMTYNVLYYGDKPACQGPHSLYHAYLETIVQYTSPDVIGLEKMAAIPIYAGDNSGTAPVGFADSILQFALNAAFPGRYAYCTYTNTSMADNIDVLFYNQQKLGFVNIISSYSNITDFNTYKLFYKSADLATTHDTVFLYVTLNHDNSGTGSTDPATRESQIAGEMAQIEAHFSQLPNMVNMGDFNTHTSTEPCYQTLVAPTNPAFRFYDAPFYPDADVAYPADWDNTPSAYAPYLTTSTRESGSVPNSCGTSGGGKSWFDHIFISPSIEANTAGLSYIPHSYRTIGNDGNRVGISVNDAPTNSSAPAAVINAIFQMSNKYPVMIDLAVNPSPNKATSLLSEKENINVVNPVGAQLVMHFTYGLIGKEIHLSCVDMTGRLLFDKSLHCDNSTMNIPFSPMPGTYFLRFSTESSILSQIVITKQ